MGQALRSCLFFFLYLVTVEGYSLSTTGTILLFYGVVSFCGNYIGGILTYKLRTIRIQVFNLVNTSIAFIGLLFYHTPVSLAFGLFITSLIADTFRPANMASISIIESPEKFERKIFG